MKLDSYYFLPQGILLFAAKIGHLYYFLPQCGFATHRFTNSYTNFPTTGKGMHILVPGSATRSMNCVKPCMHYDYLLSSRFN